MNANTYRLRSATVVSPIYRGIPGAQTRGFITARGVDKLVISAVQSENSEYGIVIIDTHYAQINGGLILNTNVRQPQISFDKAGVYIDTSQSKGVTEVNHLMIDDTQATPTTPYGVRIEGGSGPVYLDGVKVRAPVTARAMQVNGTLEKLTILNCDLQDRAGRGVDLGTVTSPFYRSNRGLADQG